MYQMGVSYLYHFNQWRINNMSLFWTLEFKFSVLDQKCCMMASIIKLTKDFGYK